MRDQQQAVRVLKGDKLTLPIYNETQHETLFDFSGVVGVSYENAYPLNSWGVRLNTIKSSALYIVGQREVMSSDFDLDNDDDGGTITVTKPKPKIKRPSLFRVLLLNDDFTPMEFVIHVVERFFHKDREDATQVMLHVHHHGVGECGVFTYEVAETKVTQVMDFARKHQHPLQCVMEKK
ncbi:ATP-dependent Clp protease adapter protein ClpS [Pseudovibrio axinellae]|uniref:ATP-dependent Clp protease adapter protein ClpS n=2 Tax=Pseudovibrio axinellae TaxID=989403 RepID=A0A161UZQ8_9HYPH|nr:ATP-dependent Clp protease adapter protein ClpS [Pseudovibrio axinellae]SER62134.1 ATP-dependent Clp protease adapter protein ClpS [Pseudovibrio axinellae]